MNLYSLSKYKKLALSLVFDAIGLVTILDIVWAPLSGYLMSRMYKGTEGKVAGVISFIEEIVPGLKKKKPFTIMWFYTYVIKKEVPEIIEVK